MYKKHKQDQLTVMRSSGRGVRMSRDCGSDLSTAASILVGSDRASPMRSQHTAMSRDCHLPLSEQTAMHKSLLTHKTAYYYHHSHAKNRCKRSTIVETRRYWQCTLPVLNQNIQSQEYTSDHF